MDVGSGREDVAQGCCGWGGRRGIGVEVAEGVGHAVCEVGHEELEVVGVPEGLGDVGGVICEV